MLAEALVSIRPAIRACSPGSRNSGSWPNRRRRRTADMLAICRQPGPSPADGGKSCRGAEVVRRALRIGEATFGPDHPWSPLGSTDLGHGAARSRRYSAAPGRLTERALRKIVKTLGFDHPNVTAIVNNLGRVLRGSATIWRLARRPSSGRSRSTKRDSAEPPRSRHSAQQPGPCVERPRRSGGRQSGPRTGALDLSSRSLGPDHPKTSAARSNLDGLARPDRGSFGKGSSKSSVCSLKNGGPS